MKPKRIKLDIGTVYQKVGGGNFLFRYQLNGRRKAVSLHTDDEAEAVKAARNLVPITQASSVEVIAAHVKHARDLARREQQLELENAWDVYDNRPDRARPATVNVYLRYKSYFADFVEWARNSGYYYLHEITDAVAAEYVNVLKEMRISVDTHNKRVARVSHVFRTLEEYTRDETSDWANRGFRRKAREEIGITARRLPFTKDEEEKLFAALEDPGRHCKNKPEIRVMFYLGAYTGQRMKDCALLQWHKVDLARQRINIAQFKTGKEVTIPIAPRLLAVLKEAEAWKTDSYVLPNIAKRYQRKSRNGKDIGAGFINNDIMRVIRWIGLEPNVEVPGRRKSVSVYGFHSLRHSFVSFCIDHNIPKAVAVSILGADSDIIDQYYTHVGEDAQERAIQLISGTTTSLKQRHEKALAFLEAIEEKTKELIELEKILRGA